MLRENDIDRRAETDAYVRPSRSLPEQALPPISERKERKLIDPPFLPLFIAYSGYVISRPSTNMVESAVKLLLIVIFEEILWFLRIKECLRETMV